MRPRYQLSWFSFGVFSLALMFSSTACSTTTGRYASKATEPPASSLVLAQTAGPAELSEVAITEITKQNGEILAAIADSQVIYLGETHNSTADHAAQLDIIQARASETDIAIGLEMFQRPFQPVLDSYLTGDITEAELIEQSEYETRWGYDWEFYAPILRYAKANQIPLIALNTPTEVTRQVAREGLKSLSGDALTYIPPVDEIDTTDEDYQASIADVFNAHGGAGHSLSFENFFAAQVLWDETMAEAIVTQLASEPNRQIIALVGEGHIAYDYGIPNRVARRVPDVEQASIRLQPAGKEVDPEFADYTWPTLER